MRARYTGGMSEAPSIDPEMLERLRRGVPLVLSRTGRFRFDGEDVTHPRVETALRRGLDVDEDGETIVHLGDQWCYLTVEDCSLRVVAVSVRDGALELRLDDGRTVPLAVETLWEEPGQGLRVSVPSAPSGRPLAARFTNPASVELSTWVTYQDDQPVLELGDMRRIIPSKAPPSAP